jgi:O-antigen ligase
MQNSKLQSKIQNLKISNLVYVVLLSLPLYLVKLSIFNVPTTVLEIEIYLLVCVFLVSSLFRKNFREHVVSFIKNPFFIPWLVFFIAGAISVFVSPNKTTALGIFKAYFLDASLFFFILVSVIKTRGEITKLFKALIISAVLLSVVGILRYIFVYDGIEPHRAVAVFSSANYLALYLAPILFLTMMFIAKPAGKKAKLLCASVVIAVCLFETYSRGAWLGVLLGYSFMVAYALSFKIKNRIGAIYLILLVFLVGFVASFFFIIKGSYTFGLVSDDRVYSSDNIRKEIWATSFDIGSKHWVMGIGLGNFQSYFGQYTKTRINYPEYITPNALTPHNVLLNIWLQMGALGVLGFLGILGMFFAKCLRGLKKERLINLIIIASMIAILGQGLVDSAIWKNDLMILFWFLIGSSYIINRKGEKNGKEKI